MNLFTRVLSNPVTDIVLTCLVYLIYVGVLAVSLVPAAALFLWAGKGLLPVLAAGNWTDPGAILTLCFAISGALYAYFFWGLVIQALVVRFLAWGVRPGRYPLVSVTTARWALYNGVYTLSIRTILPLFPATFITNTYFRILGCRMGKNVKLNSYMLVDPHLLTLGNNVVVGGQSDISCHTFLGNQLILAPISIGDDSLIGAHAYISPGAKIGRGCTIGLGCYIRPFQSVPDGTTLTSIGSASPGVANRVEKGRF